MGTEARGGVPTPRSHMGLRRVFALAGILSVLILGIWGAYESRDEGLARWQLYVIPPALLLASMGPFLFYLTDLRSLSSSLFGGIALLGATFAMLFFSFTSESTTALFGLILSPVTNLLILAIALAVDFMRFGPAYEAKGTTTTADELRYRVE